MQDMLTPESNLSSIIESPPPIADTSPDKTVKNFTRQYLNSGMWPSKANHEKPALQRGDANFRSMESLPNEKLK